MALVVSEPLYISNFLVGCPSSHDYFWAWIYLDHACGSCRIGRAHQREKTIQVHGICQSSVRSVYAGQGSQNILVTYFALPACSSKV